MHELLIFSLIISPFQLVGCQEDVTIQEIAGKLKNVVMDIKDTVSATRSTTQVKQFAEALAGFKNDVVDALSAYEDLDISDVIDEFQETLKPIIRDLLYMDVNKLDNERQEKIKESLDEVARAVSSFVMEIQMEFNDEDEDVPRISPKHLTNFMEIQHRTRRARITARQIGGVGLFG